MKFRTTWPPVNLIYLLISAVSMGVTLLTPVEQTYDRLWILPLAFLIGCVLTVNSYRRPQQNLAFLILSGGYFLRMAVTPMLFCLGGCRSFFSVPIAQGAADGAVALICYEYAVVMLAVHRLHWRKKEDTVLVLRKSEDSRTILAVRLLLVFLILVHVIVPQLRDTFPFFFESTLSKATDLRWDNETIVARGGISRILYSLFTFFWPIVRMLLPVLVVCRILEKHGNSRRGMIRAIPALVLPFLFISNDSIGPIMAMVLSVAVLMRVYGRKAMPVVISAMVLGGIALSGILAVKIISWQQWRGASGLTAIAQLLNAYFPGFENTAYLLQTPHLNSEETLFFDLYYSIPFKQTLFGFEGLYLQDLFTDTCQAGGQIMPFTAQIAHYLTPVLAPLVTAVFASTALRSEYRARATDSFWEMYDWMMTALYTAAAIHMYSFSIHLSTIVNYFLPILLIKWITVKKLTFRRKKRHPVPSDAGYGVLR